jgi:cytochrome P450
MSPMKKPPGPRFTPLQVVRYLRDPVAFFDGLRRRYGDVVAFPFPHFGPVWLLTHPDGVKWAYRSKPGDMHAGEAQEPVLGPLFGDYSVFNLDGHEHLRARKLLLPPFHGEQVRGYEDLMREAAEREIARWPVGEPFSLRERQQYLALEVILRSVFGVYDERRIAEFQRCVTELTRTRAGNPFLWLPKLRFELRGLSPWARFLRRRQALWDLVHEEIERARRDPELESRQDVLARLLLARDEDGREMTRDELRDELVTVIHAGHESTATGLAWLFERVLRHPRVEERLRAELDAGETDEYLEATIQEALRVRPVIADTVRMSARELEYDGYRIPARTWIIPSIAAVQLRDDVFPDAHEFRPERFLGRSPGTYSWIPFGGGIRRCIGAPFATLEIKVIAQAILRNVRLVAPDQRPERNSLKGIVVIPARGARVVVKERLTPKPAPRRQAEAAPAAA